MNKEMISSKWILLSLLLVVDYEVSNVDGFNMASMFPDFHQIKSVMAGFNDQDFAGADNSSYFTGMRIITEATLSTAQQEKQDMNKSTSETNNKNSKIKNVEMTN